MGILDSIKTFVLSFVINCFNYFEVFCNTLYGNNINLLKVLLMYPLWKRVMSGELVNIFLL